MRQIREEIAGSIIELSFYIILLIFMISDFSLSSRYSIYFVLISVVVILVLRKSAIASHITFFNLLIVIMSLQSQVLNITLRNNTFQIPATTIILIASLFVLLIHWNQSKNITFVVPQFVRIFLITIIAIAIWVILFYFVLSAVHTLSFSTNYPLLHFLIVGLITSALVSKVGGQNKLRLRIIIIVHCCLILKSVLYFIGKA